MGGKNECKLAADTVKCGTCFCYLDKYSAQTVSTPFGSKYYCGVHRKPYTRVKLPGTYGLAIDSTPKYYGEVEMTEDGVPVKQEKKNG